MLMIAATALEVAVHVLLIDAIDESDISFIKLF